MMSNENEIKSKTLQKFVEHMTNSVNGLIVKIQDDNSHGIMNLNRDEIENNYANGYPVNLYMIGEMLKEDSSVETVEVKGDMLHVKTTLEFANHTSSYIDEADSDEITVKCAKHILWLYGDDAGEFMKMSETTFCNTDFSGWNLNSAVFENSYFVNCNFKNTEMNFATMKDCVFENCNFEHATIEESNLANSYFTNCNLQRAVFTHCDLENSTIQDCQLRSANFLNCCIEKMNKQSCSDDEFSEKANYTSKSEYDFSKYGVTPEEDMNIEEN